MADESARTHGNDGYETSLSLGREGGRRHLIVVVEAVLGKPGEVVVGRIDAEAAATVAEKTTNKAMM